VLEAGLVAFLAAAVFGSLPYLPHLLLHMALLYALSVFYRNQLKTANTGTSPATQRKLRGNARTAAGVAAARLRRTANVWATMPTTGRA
jgi:hypothetical protein